MKKIVVSNLASPANPGDQAILRGALKLLRETYSDCSITLATRAYSQREVYEALGCQVVSNYPNVEHTATDSIVGKLLRLPKALRGAGPLKQAIADADLVFMIGGGYFYSYKKWLPGLTYLAHCMPVTFAQRESKPVFLLPQSYGPLRSCQAQQMFAKVLSRCRHAFYREEISGQWIRDRFRKESYKCSQMNDLALYLQPMDLGLVRRPAEGGSGIIGVTLRPWDAEAGQTDDYLEQLREALVALAVERDFCIRIIVQVRRPTSYESDQKVSHQFFESLKKDLPSGKVEFKTAEPYFQLNDLCALYAECDLLIGMRLHSTLLAMVSGCLPLVVGYQHKSKGILEGLGLSHLFLGDLKEVRAEVIRMRVESLMKERASQMSIIEEALIPGPA